MVVCGWTSLTKNAEKRRVSAEFTPQVQFEISENAYFAKFDIQSGSAMLISPKRKRCFGIQHTAHTERVCAQRTDARKGWYTMANNNKQELINMLVSAGMSAKDIAEVLKGLGYGNTNTDEHKGGRKGAPTPEKEMVDYTNRKGVTKRVSKAQADHWAKTAQESDERKATYATRRQAFVDAPVPKALEDAIRKNRAAVTAKEARKMGFVGTREDLKALKAQILGK